MADVAFPVVLVDGQTLDPGVLDLMVTSGTNGESLLGEMNGHLEWPANFEVGFKVRSVHVKPGAVFRSAQEGDTGTQDWTDALFAPSDGVDESSEDNPPTGPKFVSIPGTGAHVYLPYDYSAVMYRVSVFITDFRMREYIDQGTIGTPQIFLQMRIDGDGLQSTLCKLPETYRFNDGNNKQYLTNYESLNTRYFDFSYLSINGADSYCTKGWHRLSLATRIVPNGGEETLCKPFKTAGATITYDVGQRLRIGIRNARAMAYR